MDSTAAQRPVRIGELDLGKRSRGGCIDCKKAKVKCDEARPACGTCARRRHVCQGYVNRKPRSHWNQANNIIKSHKKRKTTDYSSETGLYLDGISVDPLSRIDSYPSDSSTEQRTTLIPTLYTDRAVKVTSRSYRDAEQVSSIPLLRGICPIPPGMVPADDQQAINIYFSRHPFELLIGPEFVDEMNALTLTIFQVYPEAIGSTLSAIGQTYVDIHQTGSSVSFLSKRARALAKLRDITSNEAEQLISVVLGLAAIELLDLNRAREYSMPILMGYAGSIINQYLQTGKALSSVATYFLRALARQDMVISLVSGRRPSIPTSTWLQEECKSSVDRLMGYTMTLMPLVEELCGLAEDVIHGNSGDGMITDTKTTTQSTVIENKSHLLKTRASELCTRITAWRPLRSDKVSAEVSRTCLVQAYACRSAALLYLYRLFNPAGSSVEADQAASGMACEIIARLLVSPDQVKMSLWPAFIAACELQEDDDRATAIEIFDSIYKARGTSTALQTKSFCLERVWKARDSGENWNWMHLARQYPHECVPI
ncbi:predicted protein [Paecilomyces variotii No. 5]|uniref:Zn(2)-C6 fungal-type domain-containing protein n=1 Tax=Byssochlamys spectabilis (strain No. 5 / NBRC 109023) TaxID=1356009 RepID=V5G6F2_BYSSN|nr:predicted protein [Paecilomyces variotii No. 5]